MRRFIPIGVSLLSAGILSAALISQTAFASVGPCRSDPQVTLSNGVVLTLYEDIYDNASDVTRITYTVDVPNGVSVESVSYSGAVPASIQTVNATADEKDGNYDAYTTVDTGTSGVQVTAYMTADDSVSCHTNGHNGQSEHSHLHVK